MKKRVICHKLLNYLNIFLLFMACRNTVKSKSSDYFSGADYEMAQAILSNNFNKMNELVREKKVDLNKIANKDMTFLIFSALNEKKESFEELLKLGADPNIKVPFIDTANKSSAKLYIQPLAFVVTFKDFDYAKILLKFNADPNSIDRGDHSYYSLVYLADLEEAFERIIYLINHGADINYTKKNGIIGGKTLVQLLCEMNQFEMVQKLLDLGADASLVDDVGGNLAQAIQKGSTDNIQLQKSLKKRLVQQGVVFSIYNNPPKSPFFKGYYPHFQKWFETKEGSERKSKMERMAQDWNIVGKEWNDSYEEMLQDLKKWMVTNNIPFPKL